MTTNKERQTAATDGGSPSSARSAAAGAEEAAGSGTSPADQISETAQAKADWPSAAAPLAGLAEAVARWMPEQVANAWTEPFAQASEAPWPGSGFAKDAWDYWADSCQRTVLFWDVMRKRGNQAFDHYRAGKPPVLAFDYEMVVDGRQLERPVNYALVRIKPEAGETADPKKRPFVIVDPRAGHGPGIGGFKEQSEVGVACGPAIPSTS